MTGPRLLIGLVAALGLTAALTGQVRLEPPVHGLLSSTASMLTVAGDLTLTDATPRIIIEDDDISGDHKIVGSNATLLLNVDSDGLDDTSLLRVRVDGTDRLEVDGAGVAEFSGGMSLGTIGSGVLGWSATAPTISSGFGTSPSVAANNGTAAFTVNVGTGGTATGGVVTMPTATTGWNCSVENRTGVAANRADQRTLQTATTTTSVTIQNQTISTGAALAWTASDIVALVCTGY